MNHIAASRDIAIPEPARHKPAEEKILKSAQVMKLIMDYFPNTIDEISEENFQKFHNRLSYILGEQDFYYRPNKSKKARLLAEGLTNTSNEDTI